MRSAPAPRPGSTGPSDAATKLAEQCGHRFTTADRCAIGGNSRRGVGELRDSTGGDARSQKMRRSTNPVSGAPSRDTAGQKADTSGTRNRQAGGLAKILWSRFFPRRESAGNSRGNLVRGTGQSNRGGKIFGRPGRCQNAAQDQTRMFLGSLKFETPARLRSLRPSLLRPCVCGAEHPAPPRRAPAGSSPSSAAAACPATYPPAAAPR